jgi:hypothetical protein
MVGHIITQKWLFEKRERKTYLPSGGEIKSSGTKAM